MVHVIEVHALTSCDKFRLYHQGGKLEGEVNLHEVKIQCEFKNKYTCTFTCINFVFKCFIRYKDV